MSKAREASRRVILFVSRHNVVFLILVFGIASTFLSRGVFIQPSNLINVILRASIVGVIVLGQTLVITTGGIDLSVGSNLSFILVVMTILLNQGYGIVATVVAGIALGCCVGGVNGILVSRTRIPPFIVTLGTMMILQSLALVFGGQSLVYVTPVRDALQSILAGSKILLRLFPALVYLILLLIAHYFQRYTRFGYGIYAVGANETCASYSGVNRRSIRLLVYVVSGGMCGVAAILFAYRIAAAHPQVGSAYLLDSIAAPVIGGVDLSGGHGSMLGAFGGGLLIAMLSNVMVIAGVNPFIEEAAKGAIILAYIIAVQPGRVAFLEVGEDRRAGSAEE